LGLRLRQRRAERGWSLRALARRTGIKRPVLTALEAGESGSKPVEPTVSDLVKLATALTSDPSEWLRLAGYSPETWTSGGSFFWLGESSAASRVTQPSVFRDLARIEGTETEKDLSAYTKERKLAEVPVFSFLWALRRDADLRAMGVSLRTGPRLLGRVFASKKRAADFRNDAGQLDLTRVLRVGVLGGLMNPTLRLLAALGDTNWQVALIDKDPWLRSPQDPPAMMIDVVYSVEALIDRLRRNDEDLIVFPVHPYVSSIPDFEYCEELDLGDLGKADPISRAEFPLTLVITRQSHLAGSQGDKDEILIELDRLENATRAARDEARRAGLGDTQPVPQFEEEVRIPDKDLDLLARQLAQLDTAALKFDLYAPFLAAIGGDREPIQRLELTNIRQQLLPRTKVEALAGSSAYDQLGEV
jgi:transcriptional regulator with XRE-family HTH domain